MSDSANVLSITAVRDFEAAIVRFHDSASRAVSAMDQQSQRVLQWLERDRPVFWKRQVEQGHQQLAECRTRLTQCMMRRTGDFKPSCYDEKKALEKAKRDLEFARRQVEVVKQCALKARHEVDEFKSRNAQLTRLLEGDVPRMVALIRRIVNKLEQYTTMTSAEARTVLVDAVAEDAAAAAAEQGSSS